MLLYPINKSHNLINNFSDLLFFCVNILQLPANTTAKQYVLKGESHYQIPWKNQYILLTKRQAQSLFHLLHGKTAKETAKEMNISNRTVEVYLEQIKRKMHCHNKSTILSEINIVNFLTHYPW